MAERTRDSDNEEEARQMVKTVEDRLVEKGVEPDMIKLKVTVSNNYASEIIDLAKEHDMTVMRGDRASLWHAIFEDVPAKVASKTQKPVIVIQREENK